MQDEADTLFPPDEGELEPPADPTAAREAEIERLRSAMAELEDAKIRVRRDAEKQMELLRGRVLEALIPVLDNLQRTVAAAAQAAQTHDAKALPALVQGVKLVESQFLGALAPFGLERRSSVGMRFDPRIHDAVAVIPVSDVKLDGTVVSELEPAYFIGDRVVRPAKVQVGRAAERAPS
jgi:molecular chaperone GrpE